MDDNRTIAQKRSDAGKKHATHRMEAFQNRGDAALTAPQREYLNQLREQFKTQPGRMEYREQLAASLAMLCELGFAHLRETAEKGGSIWSTDVIARLGTYVNSLTRLIDNWPKGEDAPKNIIDVLKGGKNDTKD